MGLRGIHPPPLSAHMVDDGLLVGCSGGEWWIGRRPERRECVRETRRKNEAGWQEGVAGEEMAMRRAAMPGRERVEEKRRKNDFYNHITPGW